MIQLKEWQASGVRLWVENSSVDPVASFLEGSDERIVFDLCVGDRVQRGPRQSWREMPDVLTLRPGECVRVATREKVSTSGAVFGLICSRASLAADGFYVSNIKVDPQFSGWLEIAVLNASRDYIQISKGMRFASLLFFDLRSTMDEPVPRFPTETKPVRAIGIRERLLRAAPFVLTAVLSVVGAILSQALINFIF